MNQIINISEISKRINELHNLIGVQMKTPIKTAIEIGKLLTDVKQNIGHGNFEQWIKNNCFISDVTAWKYMKLFTKVNEINFCKSLQEAYKKIEEIEYQEKLSESQKRNIIINEYQKTGVKPKEWDRSIDYEYQKKVKEDKERDERINNAKKVSEDIIENNNDDAYDVAKEWLNNLSKENAEKEKFRNKHLSNVTNLESFYDVIDEYVNTLENDTRKIEALNGIIKYCRDKANCLHRDINGSK